MGNKKLIKNAVYASKILNEVPFPDLISATSDYSIIPLDTNNKKDRELLQSIVNSANELIAICRRSRRRFQGNRVNEVGKAIEEEFVQQLRTTNLSANLLKQQGYPDIEIDDIYERKTYLESKTTSKSWDSGLRSFYFTTAKKINDDARHLLIGWRVEEERPKYWKIEDWRLVDLYGLSLKLKSEFNASNRDVYIETSILDSGGI